MPVPPLMRGLVIKGRKQPPDERTLTILSTKIAPVVVVWWEIIAISIHVVASPGD